MPEIWVNLLYAQICATMAPIRGSGLRNVIFGGLYQSKEVPKINFWKGAAKAAA